MIRDFIRIDGTSPIKQLLSRFELGLPEVADHIVLLEFRILTPDSFLWRLLIGGTIYYLYAEDFVEDLDAIQRTITNALKHPAKLELVKAKERRSFEETEPVKAAVFYKKSKNEAELMRFAVDSGYDFAFLCRSDEDSTHAYFNS